ncbi:MAG: hypothetical protein LBB09_01045 [Rickettsiales bacterium]|jgi:hypothetical protein|nr:hypothetical protein [Rickettsiales bacterium]
MKLLFRIVADKTDEALKALKSKGFMCSLTDLLGVEVPDKVGGLNEVLKKFRKNNLNIEYMYSILETNKDKAVMAFKFKDVAAAEKIARANGLTVRD